MAKRVESWKEKEVELYCQRIGVPVELFYEVNDLLGDIDNWHIREHHALPEMLDWIKKRDKKIQLSTYEKVLKENDNAISYLGDNWNILTYYGKKWLEARIKELRTHD